jgi:hypothetical protein
MVRVAEGATIGPLDKRAVRDLARAGRLQPDDYISATGTNKWIRAGKVPGLFDAPIEAGSDEVFPLADTQGLDVPRPVPVSAVPQFELNGAAEDEDGGGIPKRLIVAGASVGFLVVTATLIWFFVTRHQMEVRVRANNELRSAIERVEILPDSVESAEISFLLQTAQSLALKHKRVADPVLLQRLPRLEQRADCAAKEEEFRRVFEQASAQAGIYMNAVSEHAAKTTADLPDNALVNIETADEIWRQASDAAGASLSLLETLDSSISSIRATLGITEDSKARQLERSSSMATLRAAIDVAHRERAALAETRKTVVEMLAQLASERKKLAEAKERLEDAAREKKAKEDLLARIEKGFEAFGARLLVLMDAGGPIRYADTFRYSCDRVGEDGLSGTLRYGYSSNTTSGFLMGEITVALVLEGGKWRVSDVDSVFTSNGITMRDIPELRRVHRELIDLCVDRLSATGQNP